MKKGFKEIGDSALEVAAGGFVGKDKYDQATYNKYGITHDKNFWTKDKYWYQGNQITQKEAEATVAAAIKMGSTGVKQNFR